MYENKLKLNDDKTVFMVIGNKPQTDKLAFDSVMIGKSLLLHALKNVSRMVLSYTVSNYIWPMLGR